MPTGETSDIERTPGICGGVARVAGTQIPVWALVQYRNLGASEADLLRIYPTLQAKDFTNAWDFYQRHEEVIEEQIAENER